MTNTVAPAQSGVTPFDLPFKEIWLVDTEYNGGVGDEPVAGDIYNHGNPPNPVCLCAREFFSGREIRLWQDQLGPAPPYPLDESALFVCYSASAEMGFHAVLGWNRPARVLDLYAEFCAIWNGLTTQYENKRSLIAALVQYGLGHLEAATKDEMRAVVLAGGCSAKKAEILEYCMTDVDALEQLLPAMLPGIIPDSDQLDRHLHYALMRGRFTACLASVEIIGTPLDVPLLRRFNRQRHRILADMIAEVDPAFGVFEDGSFKVHLFEELLKKHEIPWPRTELGTLKTDDKTFRSVVLNPEYEWLEPLRELLATKQMLQRACVIGGEGAPELGADKKPRVGLVVGADGRNRTGLRAFGTVTMRNAPSTSEYIWGWSAWARSFIQPTPGHGLAACDWRQQEIAIAAKSSGDPVRMKDYQSGDTYTQFGKRVGLIPHNWPKKPRHAARKTCKVCELSIQYLQTPHGLATRLNMPPIYAKELLKKHRETYPVFWAWSKACLRFARWNGYISTRLGWVLHTGSKTKSRTICNFQMQATGAHMMQLAVCLAVESGLKVCAVIHDAIVIEAPLDHLKADAKKLAECMRLASRQTLDGFEVGVDVELIRHPKRYVDDRDVDEKTGGRIWWAKMMRFLRRRNGMTKNDPYDPDRYSSELPPLDPTEKKPARQSKHAPGFSLIPQQVKIRLVHAPATVWMTMVCLLDLEFDALIKGEPRILSNKALGHYGVSRDQKRAALDELAKRGLVTFTQHGHASPRVKLWVRGLK